MGKRNIREGSIAWYISTNPRGIGEDEQEYKRRVKALIFVDHPEYSDQAINNKFSIYKSLWVQTHETVDKHGEAISKKYRVEKSEIYDKSQLEVERVTENPYGKDWIKWKKNSYAPPKIDADLIAKAISKISIIEPPRIRVKVRLDHQRLLRAVYTDVHTGMETDASGSALFGGVWNEEEMHRRKDVLIEKICLAYSGQSEIHLIDLGDFMDGWNALTTRGGHSLPQNMDNVKAYKVGKRFKVELTDGVQKRTGAKVMHISLTNDNHSGDFASVVNDGARQVLEHTNPNVDYRSEDAFISHYIWQDHCFILSHGKDRKFRKYGFPILPDKKAIDLLTDYINFHKLHDYFIHFEKGDTHVQLFDSDTWLHDYLNYRAFSPSSEYVQTGFKKGVSGFTLVEVEKGDRELKFKPYSFEWSRRDQADTIY